MRGVVALALLAGCSFRPGAAPSGTRDGGSEPDASEMLDAMVDAPDVFVPGPCSNGVQDNDETDVDCGGSCGTCAIGQMCSMSARDCGAAICDPTVCRNAVSCKELHDTLPALGDGAYAIKPDANAAAVTTYCDMTTDGGGWTMIGKVDGRHDMYTAWLLSNVNLADMTTPTIGTNTYTCIDAVGLAVNHATTVRFSNSARDRWVKWNLPANRDVTTFWHHSVGYTTINGATQSSVTGTGWNGSTTTCYQNRYGIMNWDGHGGSYPAAARDTQGRTNASEYCMAVGTQTIGMNADGFTQNGNGFDAPADETTWPNGAYNVDPHVAVWVR
jgi:hypothetical protein